MDPVLKLVVTAFVLLVMGGPAWGAAAWVQDVATLTATQTSQTLVITTGVAVTQGHHLLVIGLRSGSTTDAIASVTDSKSNTYTVDQPGLDLNATNHVMGVASGYMATALTSTDTVTITWTNASAFNFFGGQLVEYSGLATSNWFDKTAKAATFHTQAQGIDSGATATTTQGDELVFGALWVGLDTETISAGASFSMRTQTGFAGPNWKWGAEDRIVTATGTYAATGSWITGNQDEGAIVATYKAVVGGGQVNSRMLLGVGQ